jgi:hypothetical protein
MQNLFVLKVTWKRSLRQLFICLRPPPCLRVKGKLFCRFGPWTHKYCKSLTEPEFSFNTTQHPPPSHHTLNVSSRGGGGFELETMPLNTSRARICKRLRRPGSDSEDSIPPAGPVRQIGLSYRPVRLGIDSWAP